MKRRNLFQEISDGFKDLKAHRDGKKTLRTVRLEALPELRLSGSEVRAVRESLNLSQAVFAMRLRTTTRTLQNWEQSRAQPNAQACLLIRMLERFPDMAERLAAASTSGHREMVQTRQEWRGRPPTEPRRIPSNPNGPHRVSPRPALQMFSLQELVYKHCIYIA